MCVYIYWFTSTYCSGFLVQTLQDSRSPVRHLRLRLPGRARLLTDQLQRLHEGGALEGRPTRQHLIQDHSQGINASRRAHVGLTRCLLRSHVEEGVPTIAPSAVCCPSRLVTQLLGKTEVGDLGDAVQCRFCRLRLSVCRVKRMAGPAAMGAEPDAEANDSEDVGRLEVAVDHAAPVGVVHGPRQGPAPGRRRWRGSGCRPASGQAAALDELQRKVRPAVVLADLVDLHDVRVLQPGHRLRLGAEAGQASASAWPPRDRIILRATMRLSSDWRAL